MIHQISSSSLRPTYLLYTKYKINIYKNIYTINNYYYHKGGFITHCQVFSIQNHRKNKQTIFAHRTIVLNTVYFDLFKQVLSLKLFIKGGGSLLVLYTENN